MKVNRQSDNILNTNVIINYSKLKPTLFFLPALLIVTIVVFLYCQNSLNVNGYIEIQKNCFFFINSKLSQFPNIIYNLTQLGDALIFLSFLTSFIVFAPKVWECLISALLVSVVFSSILKNIFAVPRPAAVFDTQSFTIIGKTLSGHNSLPSGHSVTIFTILTVLLFAFVPRKLPYKILWFFIIISTGMILVFTRVGVGAHYPLDVISGSIVGYISGIIGIFIGLKYKIWNWISNKKYYPIFIVLFLICCIVLINKIRHDEIIIFYLSLINLVISLFKISTFYVKK